MTTRSIRSRVEPPDWLFAAATFAVVLAVQVPFARHQAVLLDEGVILQMGDDITRGKVPYRDGVHYAFPGVFYLTAAVFEIFGPSVAAARMLAAGIFAVATAALVLMCRWWCSRAETLFFLLLLLSYRVWSFPHWHMLNYSPLAVTGALLAAWAAGEQLGRRGSTWAAAAGMFCGLAILSKQDSGGAAAVCLGAALLLIGDAEWRPRLRRAAVFAAAATAVVAACLLAVWRAGYLADLWREAVYGPLYGVTHYDYLARPALLPLFAQDDHLRQNNFSYFPQIFMEEYGTRLFASRLYRETAWLDAAVRFTYHAPWMIAALAAAGLAWATRRGGVSRSHYRRILAWWLAIAFLLAFNRPHDWIHLLVLYQPTLLLLASYAPLLRGRPVLRTAAAVVVIASFLVSCHLALRHRSRHGEAVQTARGTFFTQPAIAGGFREVLAALAETPADRPLLAYPYHPFLNFLADRPGLSRYLFLWPVEWNRERDAEIIAALEARPDTTILYSLSQLIHLGSPREFAPELYSYLTRNYSIERQFGVVTPGLSFLQLRRDPAPEQGSLRDAITQRARVVLTPADGSGESSAGDPAEFVQIVDWPFYETVVLTTRPATEVALRIPLQPRPGDRLRTAYATNPEHWEYIFYPAAEFRLAIAEAGGGEQTLLRRRLDTGPNALDRQWFAVDIDLAPWAGQDVELVLGVSTVAGTFPRNDLAGWRVPHVVAAPGG